MPVIHTTEIRYGNAGSYFSFAGMPTPFMSRSEENVFYNGKWAQTTTLTLNGTIVGKNYNNVGDTNARELNQDRNAILDGFNEDFQSLAQDIMEVAFENNLESIDEAKTNTQRLRKGLELETGGSATCRFPE